METPDNKDSKEGKGNKESKEFSDLDEALMERTLSFKISEDLCKIFNTNVDYITLGPEIRLQKGFVRFVEAQNLYHRVWNNGNPLAECAFFYRLSDRGRVRQVYQEVMVEILFSYKRLIIELGSSPKAEVIHKSFHDMRDRVNESIVKEQDEYNRNRLKIKLEILNYILSLKNLDDLQTTKPENITEFFEENIKRGVNKLADDFYFEVDYDQAITQGCIYGPKQHNWGVNVCWVLAVVKARIPILVLSALSKANKMRSNPNRDVTESPSAFSLEIAIAIKLGYGINIHEGEVTLIPPAISHDYRTNGVPGNGWLPTIAEQLNIFERCIFAKNLYDRLPSDPGGLRNEITKVCTVWKGEQVKLDAVWALYYLRQGGSLQPILEALELTQLKQLEELLATQPYQRQEFSGIKRDIRGHQIYHWFINNLESDHKVLNERIARVLNSQNEDEKTNLVIVLRMLLKNNKLKPVLIKLSVETLSQLDKLLSASHFSMNEYSELQSTVLIQLSEQYKAWIFQAFGKNVEEQKMIIDRLLALQSDQRLYDILSFPIFSLQTLDMLHKILFKPEFSDAKYDALFNIVQIYQFKVFMDENKNNSEVLNRQLSRIIEEDEVDLKFNLVDAFLLLTKPARLAVLNSLTHPVKVNLKKFLSDPMFSDIRFQDFKNELEHSMLPGQSLHYSQAQNLQPPPIKTSPKPPDSKESSKPRSSGKK